MTATYTYVRARETVDAIEQDVPLTPRHSAGIVGMWEAEDVGRVGIDFYYTGTQSLEENPYRVTSEPYMILGLPAEKQFGRIRLFVIAHAAEFRRYPPCSFVFNRFHASDADRQRNCVRPHNVLRRLTAIPEDSRVGSAPKSGRLLSPARLMKKEFGERRTLVLERGSSRMTV